MWTRQQKMKTFRCSRDSISPSYPGINTDVKRRRLFLIEAVLDLKRVWPKVDREVWQVTTELELSVSEIIDLSRG